MIATEQTEEASGLTGTLVVVVMVEGEPAPNQLVTLQGAVAGSPSTTLTTAEDGRVSFTLEPMKEYVLSATTDTGVSGEQRTLSVQAGETTEYSYYFHRIFGHVVDTDGNPIKHRDVTVRMSTPQLLSDDEAYVGARVDGVQTPVDSVSGEFRLLAASGTYQIECLEAGESLGQQRVLVHHAAVHISIMLFGQSALT